MRSIHSRQQSEAVIGIESLGKLHKPYTALHHGAYHCCNNDCISITGRHQTIIRQRLAYGLRGGVITHARSLGIYSQTDEIGAVERDAVAVSGIKVFAAKKLPQLSLGSHHKISKLKVVKQRGFDRCQLFAHMDIKSRNINHKCPALTARAYKFPDELDIARSHSEVIAHHHDIVTVYAGPYGIKSILGIHPITHGIRFGMLCIRQEMQIERCVTSCIAVNAGCGHSMCRQMTDDEITYTVTCRFTDKRNLNTFISQVYCCLKHASLG